MNAFELVIVFTGIWASIASAQPAAVNNPASKTVSNVWYTQIGRWHYWPVDSMRTAFSAKRVKSYLYHDAVLDGASSGEATANVRLNSPFVDISRFEAIFMLGRSPAIAGMLLQNKQVTYYFFVKRGRDSDSLLIRQFRGMETTSLAAVAINYSDTTHMTVDISAQTVMAGVSDRFVSINKTADFKSLTTVGFECQSGSMRVYRAEVTAGNAEVTESFDRTTLVNLHLEKVIQGFKARK